MGQETWRVKESEGNRCKKKGRQERKESEEKRRASGKKGVRKGGRW